MRYVGSDSYSRAVDVESLLLSQPSPDGLTQPSPDGFAHCDAQLRADFHQRAVNVESERSLLD